MIIFDKIRIKFHQMFRTVVFNSTGVFLIRFEGKWTKETLDQGGTFHKLTKSKMPYVFKSKRSRFGRTVNFIIEQLVHMFFNIMFNYLTISTSHLFLFVTIFATLVIFLNKWNHCLLIIIFQRFSVCMFSSKMFIFA